MSSSLTTYGHQYSSVVVQDNAYVHQGDVYHQNIVLEHRKAEVELKSFGLCLGNAPAISSDAFKGREDDLEALWNCLLPTDRSGPGRLVSIVGTGGLGKTQLSLAYARVYAHHYSSVFWLNANDETTLRQGIASLAKIIFPDSGDACLQTLAAEKLAIERVQRWLSESANDRWLLIFDNYDNPHFSKTQPSTTNGFDIRTFFPVRNQGNIMITTRSTKIFFSQQLQLKEIYDISISISILAQRSQRDLSTDPQVLDLARRLGGLPLALATAGTFLASTTMSCFEYCRLYETKWKDLCGPDAEELSEYPQRTLATTWTISLEHVRTQDEAAAKLLEFMAFFSPRDIWYELIKVGASVEIPWLDRLTSSQIRFQQAISKLHGCCLINTVAGSHQIHPCLHDWLVGKLREPPGKLLFISAITSVQKLISLGDTPQEMLRDRRLLEHVEHLQSRHFSTGWNTYFEDERVYVAASRFMSLLKDYGFYPQAEVLCQLSLKGKEQALGHGSISVLKTMRDLGRIYLHQRKLELAHQTIRQTLNEILQMYRSTPDSSLEELVRLGADDMLEQASEYLSREREDVPSPHRDIVFELINTLAGIYKKQSKRDEALRIEEWVLMEYEKAFGSENPTILAYSSNIAKELRHQGKFDMAEEHLVKALAIAEHLYGPKNRSTLEVVIGLGKLHEAKGELIIAEQMLTRALTGIEALLGPEHPKTLDTAEWLGRVFCRQGQFSRAEPMLKRALIGRQRVLGQENVRTMDTMQSIGNLYLDQTRYEEAEQMFLQVVAGYERVFGPEDENLLYPLRSLRKLHITQSHWDAVKDYERRIAFVKKVNGIHSSSKKQGL